VKRMTIDFGIDLGTTNSTIAVVDGTDAKPIPNKVGSVITPSAVWIDKRNNLHVGAEAKERALTDDPDNGDLEFKLRMGSMREDGKKVFVRSGREMLPEELSAEVLKSLKTDVQSSMGEDVRAAVVTVPAAFELPQTAATRRAACGTSDDKLLFYLGDLLVNRPLQYTNHPATIGAGIMASHELHDKIGGFEESMRFSEDVDYGKRGKRAGRFAMLKSAHILFSMRRPDKEGRITFWRKMVIGLLTYLLDLPPITFEYEFGKFSKGLQK